MLLLRVVTRITHAVYRIGFKQQRSQRVPSVGKERVTAIGVLLCPENLGVVA